MPRPEDRFANIAAVRAQESAAGTLTFAEILTGISLGQSLGIVIDEIDYYPGSGSIDDIVAAADWLACALCSSNDMTSIVAMNDRRIIHSMALTGATHGTPANQAVHVLPYVYQFFPPIIIAAPRLYLGVHGNSLATAVLCDMRMFYRFMPLTPQDYLELAETFVLTG